MCKYLVYLVSCVSDYIINTRLQITVKNFKVQNHKHFDDFLLLFFLNDLLRNILKCNCSPYSTSMTMHLPNNILVVSALNRISYTLNWLQTIDWYESEARLMAHRIAFSDFRKTS